jgi:hypothetical protein
LIGGIGFSNITREHLVHALAMALEALASAVTQEKDN